MTKDEFEREISKLRAQIEAVSMERRIVFQQDLHSLLERALRAGVDVPCEIRDLDEQLTEAAIEAQFDNLPI